MTRARARAVTAASCTLFLLYAGCFLYFFVDDEAIPLVYAHNLLRGRGLVYTVLEGRVEGYSDFLHVLWSTILLMVARAFNLSPLAPLLAGKLVSLAAGVLIIVLVARALGRLAVRASALVAALAVVALAGPLAVWSASSLETVTVALTVLAFALAIWQEEMPAAVVLGILLALERIDGWVYIGVVLAAVFSAAPSRWRRLVPIAALVGALVLAYNVWRYSYFGYWLSAPTAAKILYRVGGGPTHAVVKPGIAYLAGLLDVYGWTGLAAFVVCAVAAARDRPGRASIVIVGLLGLYAERVDDWMFGWRFTVAMVPFVAIVVALGLNRLPRRWAAGAAAAVCIWSGVAAARFASTYRQLEGRPIFWTSPRAGEAAWLGRYDELLAATRRLMHGGERIAYNQAGLLPYMLDLENIDDLGICSGFVARLPTTDVYYTGVGRYSPLTNEPVIRTAHAYLLYQNVQFLVTPMDLLLKANHGRVPEFLLDGAFRRADALHDNVIYRRTDKPIDRFAHDPLAFVENVAHYSRVLGAAIDGRRLNENEIGPRLPFLRELGSVQGFDRMRSIDVTFATSDEPVTAVYIGAVGASAPAALTVALSDAAGQTVYRSDIALDAQDRRILLPLPTGTQAARLSLAVRAGGRTELRLTDVRLEGQTAALRQYLRRTLRFPGP